MALLTSLLQFAGSGSGTLTQVNTAGLATGGPITNTGTVTVTAATQTTQEAAASNAVAVTPGTQQYHPSSIKCWCEWNGTGTPGVLAGYNAASITDGGAGIFTINYTVAMSSGTYGAVSNADNSAGTPTSQIAATNTGGVIVTTKDALSGVLTDYAENYVVCCGDQ